MREHAKDGTSSYREDTPGSRRESEKDEENGK